MTIKNKLTKRIVDATSGTGSEFTVTDTELKGFYLRVTANGEKSYGFRYKHRGQTRKMKLGDTNAMTAEEARRQALALRAAVQRGEDPAKARQDDRKAETMNDLWELYLKHHAIPNKRPRSVEEDTRNWTKHLKPRFGTKVVKEVTTSDVTKLKTLMRATPGAFNRVKALLSKMMSMAIEWEIIDRNPCASIPKYREEARSVEPLTDAQRARLFTAIAREAEEGDEGAALAIELIFYTGARRGETLNATWDQFREAEDGTLLWLLPSTSTKQRRANRKPLGGDISDRLKAWKAGQAAVGVPWVFPSPIDPRKPRFDLKGPWERIRRIADMPTLRLHDLRHDAVSFAVASGVPLEIIGQYAGHSEARTTKNYAHLRDEALRTVAEAREDALRRAREMQTGEVLPLRPAQ